MTTRGSRRWPLLAFAVLALVGAACGDDDDDTTSATDDTAADTTTDSTTGTSTPAAGAEVKVTAADYRFDGLPATTAAGTKLSLTNSSVKEAHELVALRLPDGEKRSADDLVKLPQEELESLFAGPPAAVLVAPPSGAPQIQAVGDGTLKEKGRYLVMCFVPTGADPAAFLASQGPDGPEVPGGPPHFVNGMYGQVVVE